ncbi:hypothetical protein RJ639_019155 [Escallonia herrerae]|uniref:RNase H type-1 domain-containing protein n=1 Tax=Escallonia herrerae TaxID=1293975 RepID=A0AA88VAR9_9ASTE|nr:hypothetical protein RJ639_019155 [Escallonia herrerae]
MHGAKKFPIIDHLKGTRPLGLYVDGSSTLGNSGARLILISPKKFVIEYVICFNFQASNNEAEYKALLAGMRLAHALKVDLLFIHGGSQLVVNHVLGEYEARDEGMIQYLQLVNSLATKFKSFTICQIPQDQSAQADSLLRLAFTYILEFQRTIYIELLKE